MTTTGTGRAPGAGVGTTGPGAGSGRGTGPASTTADRVRGPRWRDPRLLVGVLLVLVAVVAGARLFAAVDRTGQVWAAAHDLAPGTVLTAADLVPREVRLDSTSSAYLTGAAPTGYVVVRAVGTGELVPAHAVAPQGQAAERRFVTVPVDRDHLPPGLGAGDRVDVYVTAKAEAGHDPDPPRLVVAAAAVASAADTGSRLGGTGSTVGVVLAVAPDVVPDLVAGTRDGDVDLVRVPVDSRTSAAPVPSP